MNNFDLILFSFKKTQRGAVLSTLKSVFDLETKDLENVLAQVPVIIVEGIPRDFPGDSSFHSE